MLTSIAEWSFFIVDAALKTVFNAHLPLHYTSEDAGKLEILKTLNFYEAHDGYTWPDFSSLGYSFAQVMRLRRALVQDVFVALQRNGNVQVGSAGCAGTPESTDRERRHSVMSGEFFH